MICKKVILLTRTSIKEIKHILERNDVKKVKKNIFL